MRRDVFGKQLFWVRSLERANFNNNYVRYNEYIQELRNGDVKEGKGKVC
jgi:hypothetical protein